MATPPERFVDPAGSAAARRENDVREREPQIRGHARRDRERQLRHDPIGQRQIVRRMNEQPPHAADSLMPDEQMIA